MLFKNLKNTEFISKDMLFHFTKKITMMEKILTNQTIRFGNYQKTNDPQEYRPKLNPCVGYEVSNKDMNKADLIENNIFKYKKSFISFCQNTYNASDG